MKSLQLYTSLTINTLYIFTTTQYVKLYVNFGKSNIKHQKNLLQMRILVVTLHRREERLSLNLILDKV